MHYALIKDNIVKNIIVAEEEFLDLIREEWDYILRIDNLTPTPKMGWTLERGMLYSPDKSESQLVYNESWGTKIGRFFSGIIFWKKS